MLLQRLKEYTERPSFSLPPTLYAESPVRYILELAGDGRLLNPVPTDTADNASPATRRGQRRLVPQVQRAVGIKPLLLADKADYVLGYEGPESKPARVAACHAAFMDLLTRCSEATREPAVNAVLTFLAGKPLDQLRLEGSFDPSALITFVVDGVFVVDLPAVRAFWATENDPSLKDAPIMQCIVCGADRPVLDRLQAKLKGVPGGQTSGTSLISANAGAFESYGLEASLIAPTCADCGERFTKAANSLLASEGSRLILGGAAFIFWTREDVEFDLIGFFRNPDSGEVTALLETLRSGKWVPEIDETRFYGTVLSGSGGRAVVRDWLDTTVGEAKRHLGRWFRAQRIVGAFGEEPAPLGMYALAAATVRDANKDLAPPTPRTLIHAALTGTPVPTALLEQAVRRNRAEQRVTRPRAALIKLALCTRPGAPIGEEDSLVELNIEHPRPAYHCGRLMAVLEDIQRAAIPGINATIVDRFFGAASSSPNSVFSRLVRGAQPHLAKLERDRPGAYIALRRRIEEIMGHIPEFPRILTLTDQGLFALGYYHQHAHDRAQAREAAERRRAGAQLSADDALALATADTAESPNTKEN
jgi:CRISPR-associated protein Csd1